MMRLALQPDLKPPKFPTMFMNPATIGSSRANNDSCVLQVRSHFGSVLLPADVAVAVANER